MSVFSFYAFLLMSVTIVHVHSYIGHRLLHQSCVQVSCLTVSLVRTNHGTVQRLCTRCSAIVTISSYTPHKFVYYAPQQRGEAMLSVDT